MTLLPIIPLRHPVEERHVRVPASKSIANRELVLAAIGAGTSRIDLGPLDPGDDVRAMREALVSLGHATEERASVIVVTGAGTTLPEAAATVQAGDAGTVARFVTALAALGTDPATIDGTARLRERPLAALVRALRDAGATIDREALPLTVRGPLRGGRVTIAAHESSQFASALLLVAPRMTDGLELKISGPVVSAPFLELTIAALRARGVKVDRPDERHFLIAPQTVRARSLTIPGDASAASYAAAAAAILGGTVTIDNVDGRLRDGAQGDARVFSLLARMGCQVGNGRATVTVRRVGPLYGIRENVSDCSDVFPTLAAVATQAETPTELGGIAHTRRQESDRIAAVAAAITALGGRATAYADAIRIEPVPLRGGVVDAAGDHRIAMAFSVLGLQVPGVAIDGAETVTKTFPDFYAMLRALA
ncbi:MAG: 3-phosphoshikimate 1-carboxyvinyltransferase [Candidatus Limnocylindrales bacterium]